MARFGKPVATLLVLTLALFMSSAVLAQPAPAQPPTQPQPQPMPAQGSREVCVPTGLALAVIAGSGTVAEILPSGNTLTPTPADPSVIPHPIVVDAPAVIGACAAFEGYWGVAASGKETARLSLFRLGGSNDPAITDAVARDGLEQTRRGPSRFNQGLRAVTRLDEPGTYEFYADLRVAAVPATTAGHTDIAIEDHARVQFIVEVRGEPAPAPNAHGVIMGTVTTDGGDPIEGAVVTLAPRRNVRPQPGHPFAMTDVLGPVLSSTGLLGQIANPNQRTAPQQASHLTAKTDADGRYALRVQPGEYVVQAAARGYISEWYDDQPAADTAQPVGVKDGEVISDIDFALAAAPAPQPNPNDRPGVIEGHVLDALGDAIEGAQVVASVASNAVVPAPGTPSGRALMATTDAEGHYAMRVPAAKWLVMARAEGFAPQWYDGADERVDATMVDVAIGQTRDGIDFGLSPLPRVTITGRVTRPDGTPVRGVRVMAFDPKAQPVDPNPNVPSQPPGVPSNGISVATDENGEYELSVAPGTYAVAAMEAVTAVGRMNIQYYDHKDVLADADLLPLAAGDVATDINFDLPVP